MILLQDDEQASGKGGSQKKLTIIMTIIMYVAERKANSESHCRRRHTAKPSIKVCFGTFLAQRSVQWTGI